MGKKKLRRKIAEEVQEKMYYLNTCPNERDMILNIILPKEDRISPSYRHCRKDCASTTCELNLDIDKFNLDIDNQILDF